VENQEIANSGSDGLLIPALSFPAAGPTGSDNDPIRAEHAREGLDFGKVGDSEQTDAQIAGDIVDTGWSLPKIAIPAAGETTTEEFPETKSVTADSVRAETAASNTALIPEASPKTTPAASVRFSDIIANTPEESDSAAGINRAFHRGMVADIQTSRATRVRKRLIVVGSIAIVAIALGASIVGIYLSRAEEAQRVHQSILAECKASALSYSTEQTALAAAVVQAQPIQQITADQVSDAATVQQLASALASTESITKANACSASMADQALDAATTANKELIKSVKVAETNLTAAVGAVTQSRGTKAAEALEQPAAPDAAESDSKEMANTAGTGRAGAGNSGGATSQTTSEQSVDVNGGEVQPAVPDTDTSTSPMPDTDANSTTPEVDVPSDTQSESSNVN
jgi:hypothetical protein